MVIFSRYSWWVGAMVALAVVLTLASRVGVLDPFQGAFLRVTSPFENALTTVFEPVADYLGNVRDVNDIEEENAALRIENEGLRNENLELQQDGQRATELEQALGIVEETGDSLVAADVVTRDRSSFTDTISINKGSNAGVRAGNVVLSAQGSLVGTVTDVRATRSFVRLVTDSRSRVNAQIFETNADGIVKGTANRVLELDLAEGDINQGDRVVTSGLGGGYPPGIPIGDVAEVKGTTQDLFQEITIEPRVRLSTIGTVLVNTSFVPESATAGP